MKTLEPQADRIQADLDDLAAIVDRSRPGWTRTSLSDLDRAGRLAVLDKMRAVGLESFIDAAGNVIGRLAGRVGDAGALVTGSHTDTVEGGGRFDGNVGVVAALETVRMLAEADVRLQHDLLVVDFFSEEPNRFGISCVGSRALTGILTRSDLERTDDRGHRFGDAWSATGTDPGDALGVRLPTDRVRAFVELHVEQGPYLELEDGQIGLVSRITGLRRFRALFSGQRDHAGTTTMDRRRDAGCAAAGTVLAVERIGSELDHSRATTGRVTFTPDAVNVVSERAEILGEFRSPEADWLQHAHDALMDAAQDESARRGVTVEVEWVPPQAPTPMDSGVSSLCEAAVADLGLRRMRLYSGAEHDAAVLARRFPTAMLFVPSHGGRSHCPEEWTDLSDIHNGVNALAHSLVRIDQSS